MFDGCQKEIGKGKQAVVYFYKGFAYKVFNSDYPSDWIQHEIAIQEKISRTDLPTAHCYPSEIPKSIKMDYIDGITLGERMLTQNYAHGTEDLIQLQKQVHTVKSISLPSFKLCCKEDIQRVSVQEDIKKKAMSFLDEIEDTNQICHLDLHYLNILYAKKYYLIDWANARLGNSIFDYAKTYVLLIEFAENYAQGYQKLLEGDSQIDMSFFDKAVYVTALQRMSESSSPRLKQILDKMNTVILEA